MSHRTRLGWMLAAVLLIANLGMAARSWQETEVGWDPISSQPSYTDEVLGQFIFGTPFTALISLAILRRRKEPAVVNILR